jgi:sugar-specific transcriptional regulator TrmB
MSVDEREVAALQRLGLTEYESRIYLVLVKRGPIKASELSFFGQIPRTKTYGAIKELERKGLLRIIPGKPEVYSPSSPTEVLMPLVGKLNREVTVTEEVVQSLAVTYETQKFTKDQGPREADEFWQLEGRPGIINKLNQVFGGASRTINYVTSSTGLIRTYKANCDILERVSKKGTAVKLLAPVTTENSLVARELAEVLEFRVLDEPFGESFVTVDSHELVVVEARPEDLRTDQGLDKAIWTTNKLLVELHDQLFQKVWNMIPPARFSTERTSSKSLAETPTRK